MINPKDHPHSTPNRFSVRHELPKIAMRKSYVREGLDWRKGVNRLQEVSSETEETSKAGTGHGESLVGTGSWDRGRWRWGWNIGGSDGSTWGGGWDSRWCWGGSVGGWVHWCWGRDYGGGVDGLADGARAVGDNDGRGLGQGVGVGVASNGDDTTGRADGGVDINDLSGVDNGVVGGVPSRDRGCGSKDNGGD